MPSLPSALPYPVLIRSILVIQNIAPSLFWRPQNFQGWWPRGRRLRASASHLLRSRVFSTTQCQPREQRWRAWHSQGGFSVLPSSRQAKIVPYTRKNVLTCSQELVVTAARLCIAATRSTLKISLAANLGRYGRVDGVVDDEDLFGARARGLGWGPD